MESHSIDSTKVRLYTRKSEGVVRRYQQDHGMRDGLTSDERQRLKELERENRELKRSNDILRKASAYFAQAELDRRSKY